MAETLRLGAVVGKPRGTNGPDKPSGDFSLRPAAPANARIIFDAHAAVVLR